MKEFKLNEIREKTIKQEIKEILYKDGVIVYPTDTLYGIGGNFFSIKVIKKIDYFKQRKDQPYSIIIPDINFLNNIAIFNHDQLQILKKNLPGKFTFILNAKKSIDQSLLKNRNTIGIRIPDIKEILNLVKFLGFPLITTSVNKSDRNPLNDPEEIKVEFSEIDILINNGILKISKGSTIVDLTKKNPIIIRQGDGEFIY